MSNFLDRIKASVAQADAEILRLSRDPIAILEKHIKSFQEPDENNPYFRINLELGKTFSGLERALTNGLSNLGIAETETYEELDLEQSQYTTASKKENKGGKSAFLERLRTNYDSATTLTLTPQAFEVLNQKDLAEKARSNSENEEQGEGQGGGMESRERSIPEPYSGERKPDDTAHIELKERLKKIAEEREAQERQAQVQRDLDKLTVKKGKKRGFEMER